MRDFICWSIALCALTSASCGSNNTSLYPVVGKVTYEGEPATGAAVFFFRQGADPLNEHTIMGIVQADGSFELVCGSLGKGAPAGDYDVAIEWKHFSGQGKGQRQRSADKLGGRYSNPNRARIHVTLKPQKNELTPIDLEK